MSAVATGADGSAPRVLVLHGGRPHDVFEVLGIADGVARVRSPLLFEVGEQLALRIEQDGTTSEVAATVRAHVGPADARITELVLAPPGEAAPAGDGGATGPAEG